jgi:hypothetical protein
MCIVFGVAPLAAQLFAVASYRSALLQSVRKRFAWLSSVFPLFISFDLFAQSEGRTTTAHRWGYRLKKGATIVKSGTISASSELLGFLDFEKLTQPAVVESVASFLVNSLDVDADFDEYELLLLTKPRPGVPSTLTGWFDHRGFERTAFQERVVLTYSLEP